jgi:hypothetical protein
LAYAVCVGSRVGASVYIGIDIVGAVVTPAPADHDCEGGDWFYNALAAHAVHQLLLRA